MKLPPTVPSLGRAKRVPANASTWHTGSDTTLLLADRMVRATARVHPVSGVVQWTVAVVPPGLAPLPASERQWLDDELDALHVPRAARAAL